MRRTALILALLGLLGAGLAAFAQAQTRPPLRARVAACETGTDPAARYAVFTGSMPTRPGTAAMAMRFDLFERTPAAGWTPVALPHWGVYERTAKAHAPGFIFTKRVEQLAAPAAFRAALTFRWFDRKGRLLATERRISPVCRQPDPRPDLHVKRVVFSAKGPTRLIVVNRGRGDAGPFAVTVRRQDVSVTDAVDALPAGGSTILSFKLGRCTAGEPIAVALDSAGQVDEADEADDAVTVACPQR